LKPSKNALSQALKIVKPDITKAELFKLIDVPACFTTTTRYWLGTYGNKPWDERSADERTVALEKAKELISTASRPLDRGASRQRGSATILAEL
jgi:hypothetical protein